jgi:hypothetical protein
MIRQHDHRVDRERMTPARLTKGASQFVNLLRQQRRRRSARSTVKKKLPPVMKLRG